MISEVDLPSGISAFIPSETASTQQGHSKSGPHQLPDPELPNAPKQLDDTMIPSEPFSTPLYGASMDWEEFIDFLSEKTDGIADAGETIHDAGEVHK